ncbi:M20 family metallopeptidase [Comamonas testosteroni]|uniref:M20 family metallopeptidase n=1 Tax=Comamonas testosteroni TaxID=285 RepID=UPI0006818540|nr:M20 family metallopeptidase [Comamonas testosteroni]
MNDFSAWMQERFDDYVRQLESLVNIDSGSYHKAGVSKVLDWVAGYLDGLGIEVQRLQDGGRVVCVRATVHPGASRERSALLLGHCDTVFPEGEAQRRPFRVDGPVAYGPGVADMKAGVLMNAYLLQAWQAMGDKGTTLSALFTCDEEIGSPQSGAFIEATCRQHRYAFNSEPGRPNGNVVVGRKGGVFFDVQVQGKAAHAGANFYSGISAISALAKKIQSMEQLIDPDEGITLNVGLIRGGLSVNTVAPSAVAGVDLRIHTMAQRERCLSEVARICATSLQGETASWSVRGEFKPFVQSEGSRLLAEKYLEISVTEGIAVKGEVTGGCSDSGIAAECGCDVICAVGPSGGGFHTPEEYVRLDSVVGKATVLFRTLKTLGA